MTVFSTWGESSVSSLVFVVLVVFTITLGESEFVGDKVLVITLVTLGDESVGFKICSVIFFSTICGLEVMFLEKTELAFGIAVNYNFVKKYIKWIWKTLII